MNYTAIFVNALKIAALAGKDISKIVGKPATNFWKAVKNKNVKQYLKNMKQSAKTIQKVPPKGESLLQKLHRTKSFPTKIFT